MGKTNLIPLLTYFTKEEYENRKMAAEKAGLSVSNYNRISMGYSTFKQGKPKKKTVQTELSENSISFEKNVDYAEKSKDSDNANLDLKEYLLTEADVEDAFANLIENTGLEKNVESSASDIIGEEKTFETISGKTEKVEQNNFVSQKENIVQPNLFS